MGGSVAGLYTALELARDGHDVTVFERDPAPPERPADAALGWARPGTPQLRQSHAFIARAVRLLKADHPGLYAALRDAGAHEVRLAEHLPPWVTDRAPRAADDELLVLSARRPVFDCVLHRYAADSGVRVERTGVAGLTVDTSGAVPHVTGVRLADGGTYAADAVVDATGRQTRTPKHLAAAGVAPLPETASPCGNRYYTRYYALRPGVQAPPLQRGFASMGELDACVVLVFKGDGDAFSVSFQTDDDDEALRPVRDPRAFTAVCALAPWAAPWLDPEVAEPLNDPQVMAGQQNLLRRTVADGRPVVTGLLLAADAAATSNPTYGRGVSLALVSATLVRDALRHADPGDQALALDEGVLREVEPFIRNSAEVDDRVRARWRHRLYGDPLPEPPAGATFEDVFPAAMRDRDVWQGLVSTGGLLRTPDDLLADPAVLAAIARAEADGWAPPAPPVPDRDAILAAVERACA